MCSKNPPSASMRVFSGARYWSTDDVVNECCAKRLAVAAVTKQNIAIKSNRFK